MESKRILSIDLSTKTGWALLVSSDEGLHLEECGAIPKTSEPIGKYPDNYVKWAYQIFGAISDLIDRLAPDVLVIEETAGGSKNAFSQKILEYSHFLLAKTIMESGIESHYFLTEQWRRIVGCQMTKEEKKKNKAVRDYKKKNNNTQVAYDINHKRIGIVGRKHVNIRVANELFGKYFEEPLKRKDEDLCDGLLLGAAYHIKRMKN